MYSARSVSGYPGCMVSKLTGSHLPDCVYTTLCWLKAPWQYIGTDVLLFPAHTIFPPISAPALRISHSIHKTDAQKHLSCCDAVCSFKLYYLRTFALSFSCRLSTSISEGSGYFPIYCAAALMPCCRHAYHLCCPCCTLCLLCNPSICMRPHSYLAI